MAAGALDRTIELFRVSAEVDDGYTMTPEGWTSQGTRKARYIPAMRREIFEASGREAQLPVIFELRSDTLTRTINETWRILYAGATYDIKGVQQIGRQDGIRIEALAGDDISTAEPWMMDFQVSGNSGYLGIIL
jgi:head-tail adaptor